MSALEHVVKWHLERGGAPNNAAGLGVMRAMGLVAALLTEAEQATAPMVPGVVSASAEGDRVAFLWLGAEIAAGEMLTVGPRGRKPMGVLVRTLLDLLDTDLGGGDRVELLRLLLLAEGRAQDVPLAPLVAFAEPLADRAPHLITKLRGRVESHAPELLTRLGPVETPLPSGDAFEAFLAELSGPLTHGIDLAASPAARVLLKTAPAERGPLVVRVLVALAEANDAAFAQRLGLRALATALCRGKLVLEAEPLRTALVALSAARADYVPWGAVTRLVVAHVEVHGVEGVRGALASVVDVLGNDVYAEPRKAGEKLAALLGPAPTVLPLDLPIDEGPWLDRIRSAVIGAPDEGAWITLLRHAAEGASTSKPTKTWSKEARRLTDSVGSDRFAALVSDWLDAAVLGAHPSGARWQDYHYLVRTQMPSHLGQSARDCDVMRGLVWAATAVDDPRLPRAIGRLATRCFQKVRAWGARCPKLGNGAVFALGGLPGTAGVAHLSRLASRVRYPSGRAQIDKALTAAAARVGVDRAEIEEIGTPDFGLIDGARRDRLDDWTAELTVDELRAVQLRWIDPEGVARKSPPRELKEASDEEVPALIEEEKALREVLAAQPMRIERAWLERSTPWRFADWWDRYIDHGLVSLVARKLVWVVDGTPVLWADGALRDVDGQGVTARDDAPVTLWHPMTSTAADVARWRARVDELQLRQPIKQVWREVYTLTPAEEESTTFSHRFAAHWIRQHPLHALAQTRGWRHTMQGPWDGGEGPFRDAAGIRIYWTVKRPDDAVGDDSALGYRVVTSDEIRFARHGVERIRLVDVPPIVFSELMRDVDLFVSVCSIGADPNWVADGHATFWDRDAYGELTELGRTRAAVLQRLLPRLRIRDVAHVEDRWLVVRGTRETYRIHLGSGNVQMDGRGYLCIVPDRRRREGEEVLLPFEGDDLLSVVLSKAFLLASDDQITDPSVLQQIQRR